MNKTGINEVVESIVLGPYKGLAINVNSINIEAELVRSEIENYVAERLPAPVDEDDRSIINDEAIALLEIDGIHTLEMFEVFIAKHLLRDTLINKVMREVLDGVAITYNEEAVEEQLKPMIDEIGRQAELEGFTFAFFCSYNGIESEEQLKVIYREEIRTSYLEIAALKAIIAAEDIQLDEAKYKVMLSDYIKSGRAIEDEEDFRFSMIIKETINLLVEWNTVHE